MRRCSRCRCELEEDEDGLCAMCEDEEEDELFDADELGLDPEEDDKRAYGAGSDKDA